jgi:hypothetical protein
MMLVMIPSCADLNFGDEDADPGIAGLQAE